MAHARSAETLLELFALETVVDLPRIQGALGDVSSMTAFRYLRQIPYRRSYNHNGRYYGLHEPARYGSSRQGCESRRVKVPPPSVARNGRLAYPLLGEVTNRDRRGRRSHGCPVCCRELRGSKGVGLRARAKAKGQSPNPKDTRRRPEQRLTAVGAIGVASKLTGLNISE